MKKRTWMVANKTDQARFVVKLFLWFSSICAQGMPPTKAHTPRLKAMNAPWLKEWLEMCVHEINVSGYQGSSLKKTSWDRIIKWLSDTHGVVTTQKKLKNLWDYCKRDYQSWRRLENKTGHSYEPASGTFDGPDHVWEDMIKRYPDTKKFRNKSLEHRELYRTMFEATLATGSDSFSHKHDVPRPNSRNQSSLDSDLDDDDDDDDDDGNGNEQIHDLDVEDIQEDDVWANISLDDYTQAGTSTGTSQPTGTYEPTGHHDSVGSDPGGTSKNSVRRRKREHPVDGITRKVDDLIEFLKSEKEQPSKIKDQAILVLKGMRQLGYVDTELYVLALGSFHRSYHLCTGFIECEDEETKVAFLRVHSKAG